MRSIIASAAALLFAAATAVSAPAAPPAAPGPDVQHIMVLIAVAPSSTHGVQMTYLTFPSERACLVAAEVFAKPVENVTVVARCAPSR